MTINIAPERPDGGLSDVAHDLRGLIMVIRGYAELLQDSEGTEGTQLTSPTPLHAVCVHRILRSCGMMLDLVNNCLDLGQLEAHRLVVKTERVQLSTTLAESLAAQLPAARHKSIELLLHVDDALPDVLADAFCLERVLGNLLSNAIKYSPAHRSVVLRAERLQDAVALSIKDQGPGIPAEELARLFKPYQRASTRPTAGERSTGLGLALVERLAGLNGWEVRVESEVGVGSTFTVVIPLDRCAGPPLQ